MIIIDFLSPIGHNQINKFFVRTVESNCQNNFFLVMTKYDYFINSKSGNFTYIKLPKLLFASSEKKDSQGFLSYLETFLYSILFFYYSMKYCKKIKVKKVTFLSYNSISHVLFILLLKIFGYEVNVFEHNSIPSKKIIGFKSKFKKMIFRLCSSLVKHLVFEEYIAEHLKKEFNAKCIVIKHPVILDILNNSNFESNIEGLCNYSKSYWFSPSGSTDLDSIKNLEIISLKRGKYLLVKSSLFTSESSFVVIEKRFDEYSKLLSNSEIIFIGCNFDYRVSGVFYEALAARKPVVITRSIFSMEVAKIYPNVFVCDNTDMEETCDKAVESVIEFFDIEQHNLDIKKHFLGCVNA